jgi:hypothetical protein
MRFRGTGLIAVEVAARNSGDEVAWGFNARPAPGLQSCRAAIHAGTAFRVGWAEFGDTYGRRWGG